MSEILPNEDFYILEGTEKAVYPSLVKVINVTEPAQIRGLVFDIVNFPGEDAWMNENGDDEPKFPLNHYMEDFQRPH